MSKVNSPGILARHLVLPQINLDEDANVDSDVPSFHVLLQKSLKVNCSIFIFIYVLTHVLRAHTHTHTHATA